MTSRSRPLVVVASVALAFALALQDARSFRFTPVDGARKDEAYACAVTAPVYVRVTEAPGQGVQFEIVQEEVPTRYEIGPRGPEPEPEPQLRDLLPFDPGPGFETWGSWVAERVEGGWLIGVDRGEFGGGLWYSRAGTPPQQLLDRRRVYAIGTFGDPYALVTGLDPTADREATSIIKLRQTGSEWRTVNSWLVKGPFLASHEARGRELYVLTRSELALFTGDTVTTLASELDGITELGPPFWFAGDENSIYVGMQMMMLQADRRGGTPPRWFIPNRCRETRRVPVTIVGFGHEGTFEQCECIGSDG